MTREFVYIKKFSDKWGNLGLVDEDLVPLEKYIMEHPSSGVLVRGTGGLRKLRWALPDKGKRGGVRIAYIDLIAREKTYMLDIFPKSEKDNYSDAEKAIIKQLISGLMKEGE